MCKDLFGIIFPLESFKGLPDANKNEAYGERNLADREDCKIILRCRTLVEV